MKKFKDAQQILEDVIREDKKRDKKIFKEIKLKGFLKFRI